MNFYKLDKISSVDILNDVKKVFNKKTQNYNQLLLRIMMSSSIFRIIGFTENYDVIISEDNFLLDSILPNFLVQNINTGSKFNIEIKEQYKEMPMILPPSQIQYVDEVLMSKEKLYYEKLNESNCVWIQEKLIYILNENKIDYNFSKTIDADKSIIILNNDDILTLFKNDLSKINTKDNHLIISCEENGNFLYPSPIAKTYKLFYKTKEKVLIKPILSYKREEEIKYTVKEKIPYSKILFNNINEFEKVNLNYEYKYNYDATYDYILKQLETKYQE